MSPSNSGLISFRIDWFDFLAVQRTLKCLLQHHNSKASILHCSVFFMVQLSYLYMTTGKKIIAMTICTFVSKVMSLLFLQGASVLISWLQSLSAVISEPPKVLFHCFHFFPFYFPWSDRIGCHNLSFSNAEFQASPFTLLFYPHQEALKLPFTFCH